MAATKTCPVDVNLVAACGLYCGACGKHTSGRCPGCAGNDAATWCPVRRCVQKHGWRSCADCTEHADPRQCPDFNHWISRVVGYCLGSNRPACIARIREVGAEAFAKEMAEKGTPSIHKGSWNPLDW